MIDPLTLALLVAWAVIFGGISGWLARRRDRAVPKWIVFGAILGPVAVLLLWMAPPGRCRRCLSPVRGWQTRCSWCGMDVRGDRQSAPSGGGQVAVRRRPAAARPATRNGPDARLISVVPTSRPTDETASAGNAPAGSAGPPSRIIAAGGTPASESPAGSAAGTEPSTPRAAKPSPSTAGPSGTGTARSIGSTIYVTGTVGLAPGARYDLQTDGRTLHVVVPSRRKNPEIAFERPLAGVDAAAVEGRLIISASRGRAGTVLVFMTKDGGSPDTMATVINDAVRTAQESA